MGVGTKFTGGGAMTLFEPGRPILGPIAMSAKTLFLFNTTHGSERRMFFIAWYMAGNRSTGILYWHGI